MTSDLLDLAVFLPDLAAGRRPPGRPHHLPHRAGRIHGRLHRLRVSRARWSCSRPWRLVQGVGGAMMVPVGRLIILRSVSKAELVAALASLTIPSLRWGRCWDRRSAASSSPSPIGAGSSSSTFRSASSASCCRRSISSMSLRSGSRSTCAAPSFLDRPLRACHGHGGGRPSRRAGLGRRHRFRRRHRVLGPLHPPRPRDAQAAAGPFAVRAGDIRCRCHRRQPVPHRHGRERVPGAADAPRSASASIPCAPASSRWRVRWARSR